ncbi:MAG: alpha/beta hydrolase [Actinomycetota bacterium]|nr:alpha/beta hydrolase [Actinomycetota bacterium]
MTDSSAPRRVEFPIPALGRPAVCWMPEPGPVRGGIVALHGASSPIRRQPLFDHLASTLAPLGWAVLAYDRRASTDGGDVPLDDQATDALVAAETLRGRLNGAPVGLYGFSQGAWAASVAAARAPGNVAALAVVGCSGVSPAAQMRYFTSEVLRRKGFGDDDLQDMLTARQAYEDFHRRRTSAAAATAVLGAVAERPWFSSVYLPATVSAATPAWDDIDFDPAPIYRQVRCPTLLMYGDDEEYVPAAESTRVWRTAAEGRVAPTVVMLPDCGHFPARQGDPEDIAHLSADYTQALIDWFSARSTDERTPTLTDPPTERS